MLVLVRFMRIWSAVSPALNVLGVCETLTVNVGNSGATKVLRLKMVYSSSFSCAVIAEAEHSLGNVVQSVF